MTQLKLTSGKVTTARLCVFSPTPAQIIQE
jgi:hypothetical protein